MQKMDEAPYTKIRHADAWHYRSLNYNIYRFYCKLQNKPVTTTNKPKYTILPNL